MYVKYKILISIALKILEESLHFFKVIIYCSPFEI